MQVEPPGGARGEPGGAAGWTKPHLFYPNRAMKHTGVCFMCGFHWVSEQSKQSLGSSWLPGFSGACFARALE